MVTPRVATLTSGTCHVTHEDPAIDRELRCDACGNRMFSSRAPALLASGVRCSRCSGNLALIPGEIESVYLRGKPSQAGGRDLGRRGAS